MSRSGTGDPAPESGEGDHAAPGLAFDKHTLASHDSRAPRLFVALLLALSVVQVVRATAPARDGAFQLLFSGQNAARYALAGRNYLRDGFTAHQLAPSFRAGEGGGDAADLESLYLHHPPATPLLVGASFARSGESEDAATFPFLVLGVLVPLLIALATRPIAGGTAGAFAAFLYACTPMTALYGAHVDPQGPILLAPLLLTVWAYARYVRRGRALDLTLLLCALLLSLFADWPAAILAFAMPVSLFGRMRRDERRGILLAPALALLFMAGFVAWIYSVGRSPVDALFASKDIRGWAALLSSSDVVGLAGQVGMTFVERVSAPVLALSALALVPAWTRDVRVVGGGFGRVIGVLFLVGGTHVLLFPAGAAIHDYWSYLLVLPIAIAAGTAVEGLRRFIARRQGVGFSLAVAGLLCGGCWFVGSNVAAARLTELRQDPVTRLLPDLGRIVREQTRPDMRLATNLDVNPGGPSMLVLPAFTYYADRSVVGKVWTEEDLQRALLEPNPPDTYVYFPIEPAPPILKLLFERDPKHRRIEVPLPPGSLAPMVKLTLFDLGG